MYCVDACHMIYLGCLFPSIILLTILGALNARVLEIINKLISAYGDDLFLLIECLHLVRLYYYITSLAFKYSMAISVHWGKTKLYLSDFRI